MIKNTLNVLLAVFSVQSFTQAQTAKQSAPSTYHFYTQMGLISSFSSQGNTSLAYINPQWSKQLNSRWSVYGGVLAIKPFNFGSSNESGLGTKNNSLVYTNIGASYRLNSQTIVYGDLLYNTNTLAKGKSLRPDVVRLGARYKVAPNFEVGIEIEQRQYNQLDIYGNQPSMHNGLNPNW